MRLSQETADLITAISKTYGISKTDVMEMAIRRWARQENISAAEVRAEAEQSSIEMRETKRTKKKADVLSFNRKSNK